ncbi:uncharacterized methyltransferase At1g78140, chloroplastic isoform X2 [Juglans microcarpa x Juglans regia]|uniref:uncharacterized methyltransferase At1g78140, chloroplastic isoform X2 n=1 Tax=Juglans microcarpa x Juglans regia TaxID=2249226 RepID=UPI001B7E65C4|nr:uncharacterized methyltransferase At1g78140, chloroplastic isoform X2 [Juglans microcarpa x Juglans regia]
MATLIMSNPSLVFLPSRLRNSRHCFFESRGARIFDKLVFAVKARASSSSSTTFVETKPPTDPILVEKEAGTRENILACPICYELLTSIGNPGISLEFATGSTLQCRTCKKSYSGNGTHLDLTVASGAKDYGESMPASTELFRFPLISFLYERGWRQSFSVWGGFPGPEKEFELMKDFLKPVLGGNIVDASCGSGLFSRLFAKSGLFSLVVALDYSENMLRQCYEFVNQEENFPKGSLSLVRADISRLPFVSSSVDAVHAGAALHCWPSPSAANISEISGSYIFLSERELADLCRACGLVGFTCIRNGPFVMISASKPS